MIKGLAGAAAVFAVSTTAVAQHNVKSGIDAWQRGDYSAAVSIWRPLAENGNADAEFDLGQAYRLGRGVPIDLAQAQLWLEKAASAGHLDAQTTLGLLLFDTGNRTGAMRWLKKAAERGEPRAMLVYGTALYNGDGVPRDPVLAYAYVSRSAAQGLEPAKRTLADMDQSLPVEIRQKALTMAMSEAKTAPAPTSAAPSTKAPQARTASKPPKAAPVQAAIAGTAGKPGPPSPSASGGWRIQLGAFSQRGSAEALYRKLSGSLAGRQAFYIPAGAVIRLQVGPYPTRIAAASACASLKGQACFPVVAK